MNITGLVKDIPTELTAVIAFAQGIKTLVDAAKASGVSTVLVTDIEALVPDAETVISDTEKVVGDL